MTSSYMWATTKWCKTKSRTNSASKLCLDKNWKLPIRTNSHLYSDNRQSDANRNPYVDCTHSYSTMQAWKHNTMGTGREDEIVCSTTSTISGHLSWIPMHNCSSRNPGVESKDANLLFANKAHHTRSSWMTVPIIDHELTPRKKLITWSWETVFSNKLQHTNLIFNNWVKSTDLSCSRTNSPPEHHNSTSRARENLRQRWWMDWSGRIWSARTAIKANRTILEMGTAEAGLPCTRTREMERKLVAVLGVLLR
jgi:hypothetical protein